MRKIRNVLRYRHNLSLDAIARALNISKGVVAKYLKRAADVGMGWPLPDEQPSTTPNCESQKLWARRTAIRSQRKTKTKGPEGPFVFIRSGKNHLRAGTIPALEVAADS